jgi:hypothetical protein
MKYSKILVPAITLFIVFTFISLVQAKDIPGLETFEIGGEENWELKKNKKGIKCYTRRVKISPMHCFRGIIEVKGTISNLVGFLMDIGRYTEWMFPTDESYILDRINETEAYIYTVHKPPWPASTRDIAVRRQWYYNPDTGAVTVTIKGLPEYVPPRDKIVRGNMIMAYYQLVPISDNTVEITYEVIVDPGGWLPVWLLNFMLVYGPYSTLHKIQGYQPFDEHKGKTYDFIKPRLLSENKPKNHNQDQRKHANQRGNDYQEELEKQLRKVTYDQLNRYYFDDHPYGAQGQMKCYVLVKKGCPDVDIDIQTVDDYKWSAISSFNINGEENKGKTVIIPDAELSRKSHTPSGVAFGINGDTHNNVDKVSGKVITKLIDSYMKRSGADILLKIEKDKDPYIIYLFNEKEMTQKEIQDEEFMVGINKYVKSENKIELRNDKKKRWWFIWWLKNDGD